MIQICSGITSGRVLNGELLVECSKESFMKQPESKCRWINFCNLCASKLLWKHVSATQQLYESISHFAFFHLLQFRVQFTLLWCGYYRRSAISWTAISNKRWEDSSDLCKYPQGWCSEYVNPYMPTHNPWRRLKVAICKHKADGPFYRSLISALVICKQKR